MKNPFRVDKQKELEIFRAIPSDKRLTPICKCGDRTDHFHASAEKYNMQGFDLIDIETAKTIFADLDKIILSGYPYKRFHPRKYNMLKKKYL